MKLHLRTAALPALLATLVLAPVASATDLRVSSTSDTRDAGLVDDLLTPAFDAAFPGDSLKYTAVGTGKALDNARAGLADVVITHAPSLEAKFVADGFSTEPYAHAIFYSDYVIIGPKDDPARVLAGAPHDAITALEEIAAAGADGKATFVSRGDNSGTNVQEQIMWGMTSVAKQPAFNAGTDATRFEPAVGPGDSSTAGPIPPWYGRTGKLQAANVEDASVCASSSYPDGGCYTMVDRGTYNRLVNAGTVTNLQIVSQNNSAGARGGENLLINPFSAYVVNPAKFADQSAFNTDLGQRFIDFLTSPAFQAQVDGYPTASDPAFRSDAFPAITLTTALPQVANTGQTVPIDLTATNKLPGGGVVAGLPIQLQVSTDNGATYANAGAPVSTDASGHASLRPVLAASTKYRVSVPRYHQFSASTTDLGLVGAIPAPAGTSKDTVAPTVTKPALTTKKITLTLSEAGKVKVTIKRRVTKVTVKKGKRKTTTVYRTSKAFTVTATKAGTYSRTFKTIAAGRYKVTLVATDAAGNTRASTKTLTVKAAAKSKRKAG